MMYRGKAMKLDNNVLRVTYIPYMKKNETAVFPDAKNVEFFNMVHFKLFMEELCYSDVEIDQMKITSLNGHVVPKKYLEDGGIIPVKNFECRRLYLEDLNVEGGITPDMISNVVSLDRLVLTESSLSKKAIPFYGDMVDYITKNKNRINELEIVIYGINDIIHTRLELYVSV